MPSPRSPTPTSPTSSGVAMVVLIDDRLLIEHLLVGLSVAQAVGRSDETGYGFDFILFQEKENGKKER